MESTKFLASKYYQKVVGEESDDGDDIPSSQDLRLAQLSGRIRTLTRICSLLLLLLGTAVVLLLVHTSQAFLEHKACPPPKQVDNPNHVDFEGILRTHAPHFALINQTFTRRADINNDTFDPYDKTIWEKDMPRGRGFVKLPNADGTSTTWGVSGLHQLHCVYSLQTHFAMALERPGMISTIERRHVLHCADLLRQAIRCTADPTLDPAFAIPGRDGKIGPESSNFATYGSDGNHICRDYDKLKDWAEEHRVHDSKVIDPHNID